MGKAIHVPLDEVSANRPLLWQHLVHHLWTFLGGFIKHFDLALVGENILDAGNIISPKAFVCRMYKTSEDSLDLAHVVLFGKVSSQEKLPLTSDAFNQHLRKLAKLFKIVISNPF